MIGKQARSGQWCLLGRVLDLVERADLTGATAGENWLWTLRRHSLSLLSLGTPHASKVSPTLVSYYRLGARPGQELTSLSQ